MIQPRKPLSTVSFSILYFVLIAVLLLFSDKGQIAGDGLVRWEALDTLLTDGELTKDKYSIVQPILASPLYLSGMGFGLLSGASDQEKTEITKKVVQRFNKVLSLMIVVWMFRTLTKRVGLSYYDAALAGYLLLFATILIPNAKDFYSECLWSLLCLGIITLIVDFHERSLDEVDRWKAVFFLVLMALVIPLNPILGVVFSLMWVLLAVHRLSYTLNNNEGINCFIKADLVMLALSLPIGAGMCFFENWLRRGEIMDFGYPGEGFSTPFLVGFSGQLFSPTRGIIFFIPTFFLGFLLMIRSHYKLNSFTKKLVCVSLLFCSLLFIAYSKWHAWHGAWYWGPRFLLPLAIFSVLYTMLFLRHKTNGNPKTAFAVVALLVASYMTYKVGVSIGQDSLVECLQQTSNAESCYWEWKFLPFASWLRPEELVIMLSDRSTAVEIAAIILGYPLFRRAP